MMGMLTRLADSAYPRVTIEHVRITHDTATICMFAGLILLFVVTSARLGIL
jgi:hypothetical protein